jgi:hypothetical protein
MGACGTGSPLFDFIRPYNFPLFLVLQPLIGAMAAGCAAVVKPSELAIHTAVLLAQLFPKYLDKDLYKIVNGGPIEAAKLLELKWNHSMSFRLSFSVLTDTGIFPADSFLHRKQARRTNHSDGGGKVSDASDIRSRFRQRQISFPTCSNRPGHSLAERTLS